MRKEEIKKTEIGLWYGKPVESLTKKELLGLVGYLNGLLERQKNDYEEQIALMESIELSYQKKMEDLDFGLKLYKWFRSLFKKIKNNYEILS